MGFLNFLPNYWSAMKGARQGDAAARKYLGKSSRYEKLTLA
jgi:hypothetical protein